LTTVELSIVIPVVDSADLLSKLLRDLEGLAVTFEVFVIDGGSTDGTAQIIHEYAQARRAVYNISLSTPRPAGLLRNLAIPLIDGEYTLFVDADDGIDAGALNLALEIAKKQNADVMMLPYSLAFVTDEGPANATTFELRGMDPHDREVWANSRTYVSRANKRAAFDLIAYPWNRLVRSSLLLDEQIYFGSSMVQNDVQFHFHTIAAAKRIAFLPADTPPVCVHRKFKNQGQLTKVASSSRLEMIGALQLTHRLLSSTKYRRSSFHAGHWTRFVTRTFDWARNNGLVPRESLGLFRRAQEVTERCSRSANTSCFFDWWQIRPP